MELTAHQREFIQFCMIAVGFWYSLYMFGQYLLWQDSRKQKRKNEDIL